MNHSPPGRVGLSGPERVVLLGLDVRCVKPSPATTASNPPTRGKVMQVFRLRLHVSAYAKYDAYFRADPKPKGFETVDPIVAKR